MQGRNRPRGTHTRRDEGDLGNDEKKPKMIIRNYFSNIKKKFNIFYNTDQAIMQNAGATRRKGGGVLLARRRSFKARELLFARIGERRFRRLDHYFQW